MKPNARSVAEPGGHNELRVLLEDALKNDDIALRDNVLAESKKRGVKHRYPVYFGVFRHMLKNRELTKLPTFLQDIPDIHKPPLYEDCLHAAVNNNSLVCAEPVLEAMDKFVVMPSVFACNSLLNLYLRERSRQEAMTFFVRMKGWRVVNSFTYKVLINRACDSKTAVDLLEDMRAQGFTVPTDVMVNYLTVLAQEKDAEGCLRVLEQMKEQGPPPDIYAYTAVMRVQEFAKRKELFEDAIARGLQPIPFTWTLMLLGAHDSGDDAAFDDYAARMRAQGASMSAAGYATQLVREFRRKNYNACLPVIEEAIKCNVADSRMDGKLLEEVEKEEQKFTKWGVDGKWIEKGQNFKQFVIKNHGLDFVRALIRDHKSLETQQ